MTCEEILQTVRGFCAREGLLEGRRQIALAVSGGADSMALLCLMRPLAEENGIALTVCHVNHGLRGETADRDEAFVREACARLGLPLRVFHAAELEAEVGRPQAGEDWARRLRYACFGRLLAEGIDAVATAHTGSDQAETLLFRLARGTGLHGAAGIRPSRPGYLRPLLCLTRADTEAVCRACGETLGDRRDQRGRRLRPQPPAPRRTACPLRSQPRRRAQSGPLLREGRPGGRILRPAGGKRCWPRPG